MILLKLCNFRRLFYILYKIVWGVLRLSVMYTFIKDGSFDTVNIDELQLLLLLFADDIVLFSFSKEGL